jgi:hypothetical protein
MLNITIETIFFFTMSLVPRAAMVEAIFLLNLLWTNKMERFLSPGQTECQAI